MIWRELCSGGQSLCLQPNLRIERLLVGVIYPGKTFDLSAPCFGVQTLDIALFANFDRSVHEDFNETIFSDHTATFVARCPVRAHRRADYRTMVPDNFGRYETDPKNVRIPVFLAESQALR